MKTMELNKETEFILGRPNFWCGSIAPLLRNAGHKIPKKAEAEQAHVIHWMLGMYEAHGSDWKDKTDEALKEMAQAK